LPLAASIDRQARWSSLSYRVSQPRKKAEDEEAEDDERE